jgi:parvulin-like peptidyl-prolyl isomerase
VNGQRALPSHAVAAPPRPAASVVARVNGVALMSDRLDAAVNRLLPFESFHRGVKPEKLAAVRAKALKDLVDEELQYQHGVQLGIRATEPEVERVVAQARRRFPNAQAFESRLRASGATVTELRREIQRSIVVQKTLGRVVAAQGEVGAREAKRFFEANPERFIVPEQLHVFAITIGVAPAAPPAAWSAARARLEDVRRQLQHGTRFEDLARTHSTDPSRTSGGDMGFVHRGSLNDEFEQALRPLEPGQVSDIVKTLYGFHLVRLAEIRPPQSKTFADVGTELRRSLTRQRCDEMKTTWIARLRAGAGIVP